jgi:hypothetical protein
MTVARLILNVRRRDVYPSRLLFLGRVYLVICLELRHPLQAQYLRDRRRQRRLAMVYVADRSHVTCGFVRSNFAFAISPPYMFRTRNWIFIRL